MGSEDDGRTRAKAGPPKGARKRGRTATISRDQIVWAAIAVLERGRDRELVMADIAGELGGVPAAIYRHFENKSEVMAAVSNELYSKLDLHLSTSESWQERVSRWAHALRDLLHAYPTVERIYSWDDHFSTDWVRFTATLGQILAAEGLEGRALAGNMVWLMRSVASYVAIELESKKHPLVLTREDLVGLAPEDAHLFEALIPHLEDFDVDAQFEYCVRKMIMAVELDLTAGDDEAALPPTSPSAPFEPGP